MKTDHDPIPARGGVGARLHGKTARVLVSVLLAAGACLTYLGVRNGGLKDALVKAVNICAECIGLG